MKVLIAESDNTSRELLERMLSRYGHEVISVGDGSEAMVTYKDARPDMVISDWSLSGLSGLDISCEIRKLEAPHPKTYLILTSARSNPDDILRGIECGVDDFFAKPLNTTKFEFRLKIAEKVVKRRSADITEALYNPILVLREEHRLLLKLVSALELIQAELGSGDVPRDILEWALSTAFILNIQIHHDKEEKFMGIFLDNIMASSDDWSSNLWESSFATVQSEHEELESLHNELQGNLFVYLNKMEHMLKPLKDAIKEASGMADIPDRPEDFEKAIASLGNSIDGHFIDREDVATPLKESIKAFTILLKKHMARENDIFFPYAAKFIPDDDMKRLYDTFEELKSKMGVEKVRKNLKALHKLSELIKSHKNGTI